VTRRWGRGATELGLWVLAGIAGIVITVTLLFEAFPEASVDFRISRGDAERIAREFLTARGERLDGYTSAIAFRVDDPAKTYLERELGLGEANRLMASGDVAIFAWDVRAFRELQREEFSVRVDPRGRVVGARHVVEEAKAGARLERDAARAVAESLFRSLRPDAASYGYLPEEANATDRPGRRDWTFTWERTGFHAKDAPYRVRVTVQGDRADGYEEFLKVPEAWQRDFAALRSTNFLYQIASEILSLALIAAMIVVLFRNARRGWVRWRGLLLFALVVGGLVFAMAINALPLTIAGYDTNTSLAGFVLLALVGSAAAGLFLGLLVAAAAGAADPLYRERFPGRLRLGALASARAIGTAEFFRGSVVGLSLAGAHLGGVVLFYIVTRQLGFWVPQDIRYNETVATAAPWLFPLGVSVQAATLEELIFRLFAVLFLMRVTGSLPIAVVLPALVWGFGHSAYPVEPGYARGIEVGAIGIVAGLVFLRYGIVATLVWHYTVDALLIGLLLLRSTEPYFFLSGALVAFAAALPLLVATVLLLRRRRFVEDAALTNAAAPLIAPPAEARAPAAATPHEAASPRRLRLALSIAAGGVLLWALAQPAAIGSFLRVPITSETAAAQADAVLRSRGIDPASYLRAVTIAGSGMNAAPASAASSPFAAATQAEPFDAIANEYLRRTIGIPAANRLYEDEVPSAFWVVRYFRSSEKEEYGVLLHLDGRPYAVRHLLAESAPGADLSKDDAQARAAAYLRAEHGFDLSRWRVVEATSQKLPARTDHTVVWERSDPIGEATVRAEVRLSGGEVADHRVFLKVPEEFARARNERGLAHTIHAAGQAVVFGGGALLLVVLFVRGLRAGRVPWRTLALAMLVPAAGVVLSTANELPGTLARYPTQLALPLFAGFIAASAVIAGAAVYGALLLGGGAAWLFHARAFGGPGRFLGRDLPGEHWRDAVVLGVAGAGIALGLGRFGAVADAVWPVGARSLPAAVPGFADSFLPALGVISSAALVGGGLLTGFALVTSALVAYVRRPWRMAGILVLVAVFAVGQWEAAGDLARGIVVLLAQVAVGWWTVAALLRRNVLAYAIAAALLVLVPGARMLLSQPNLAFQIQGVVVAAIAVGLVAVPVVLWRRAAGGAAVPVPAPVSPG
jgi:hypothetical protein